jgi:hypothetical protein
MQNKEVFFSSKQERTGKSWLTGASGRFQITGATGDKGLRWNIKLREEIERIAETCSPTVETNRGGQILERGRRLTSRQQLRAAKSPAT